MTDPRDRTPAMTSPTTLTAAAEPVVTLEDASFSYGSSTVLTGVTGRVPAGQALALVGPNGSGKTTLMRALLGMVTVSRGRVRVNGAAPGRAPRGSVGYVPQLSDLDPTFPVTVREVVQMGMYSQLGILRRPGAEARRRALEALDSVGLADRASHLPRQLSGGEQQRVCVARALINYPKLLLADEPTGNLDETNEEIVLDLFNQLHQDGTTLMVVTHDALVAEQGQREIRLDHGKVVKETWHDHDFEQRASGLVLPGHDGVARSGKDKVR